MDVVIVDGETKLKPVGTKAGKTRYHEIYFGWATGLYHEFEANLSPNEVAEAFREKRRARVA
jgi:hypothetical protein